MIQHLVDAFVDDALGRGWDTHEGSSGRCWAIAHDFALHAARHGRRVELWQVLNPRSTRRADDQQNFAVLDGCAVDFASRAGAYGAAEPWPIVEPLAEYLARYGPRVPMCATCGSTGDIGPGLRQRPLAEHDCPGLLPLELYMERLRRQVAAAAGRGAGTLRRV